MASSYNTSDFISAVEAAVKAYLVAACEGHQFDISTGYPNFTEKLPLENVHVTITEENTTFRSSGFDDIVDVTKTDVGKIITNAKIALVVLAIDVWTSRGISTNPSRSGGKSGAARAFGIVAQSLVQNAHDFYATYEGVDIEEFEQTFSRGPSSLDDIDLYQVSSRLTLEIQLEEAAFVIGTVEIPQEIRTNTTFVTIIDEKTNLPSSVKHSDIAYSDRHPGIQHHESHEAGGDDPVDADTLDGVHLEDIELTPGPPGPKGEDSIVPGPPGTNGTDGVDGKTILSGSGVPSDVNDGTDGDYWLRTSNWHLYFKAGGVWTDTVTIKGVDGADSEVPGPPGEDGVFDFAFITETKTDTYDVLVADKGKTLVMDAASAKIFNLPSVAAGDIGIWFTFAKVNTGKVTIQAADSDIIADSSAGGTIYDDMITMYDSITLQLVSATQWVITGLDGTWVTT